MKTTIYIILLIFAVLVFKYLFKNQVSTVTVENDYSQKQFLVRDLSDKNYAAKLLCEIKVRLIEFTKNLYNDMISFTNPIFKEYFPYVSVICKRLDGCIFSESAFDSSYTSYTVNKGKEMVVCLRDKTTNKLHDINTLMYVCVHEIAHIGCPEVGHTHLFNKINKFLLEKAILYKVYTYENYKKIPRNYCGLRLDNTVIDNAVKV